jgi:hypothetical protein
MAWLGFGPESELEHPKHGSSRRGWREADDATAAELAETIRLAQASEAESAARKAMDEIVALERDLGLAREQAAARLEELDGRLSEMKRRARAAERVASAERRAAELDADGDGSGPDGPRDPLEALEAGVLDGGAAKRSADAPEPSAEVGRGRFRRLLAARSRTD